VSEKKEYEVTYSKHSANVNWSTSGIPVGTNNVVLYAPAMGNEALFLQFYGNGTYWTSATSSIWITAVQNWGASPYFWPMATITSVYDPITFARTSNYGPVWGGSRITVCSGGGCISNYTTRDTAIAQFDSLFTAGIFPPNQSCAPWYCGALMYGTTKMGQFATIMQPSWSTISGMPTSWDGTPECDFSYEFYPSAYTARMVHLTLIGITTKTACYFSMGGYTSVNGVAIDSAIDLLLKDFFWTDSNVTDDQSYFISSKCPRWPGTAEYSTSTISHGFGQYGPSSLDFSGTTGGIYNVVLGGSKYLLSQYYDFKSAVCPSVIRY